MRQLTITSQAGSAGFTWRRGYCVPMTHVQPAQPNLPVAVAFSVSFSFSCFSSNESPSHACPFQLLFGASQSTKDLVIY